MIYVMNDAFQTPSWFYTGCYEEGVTRIPEGTRVTVPSGFAAYTGDSRSPNPPRSLVEKGYNLVYWVGDSAWRPFRLHGSAGAVRARLAQVGGGAEPIGVARSCRVRGSGLRTTNAR
jgi:hypothetical protein